MRIIHKALGISLLVHLVIVVFFAVLPFVVTKKRYTPVYQVNLVTQPEPSPKEPQVVPEKKKPPVKPPTEVKKKAPPVTRKKTEKKKPDVRPKKDTQSEQSLDRVQRAIDKIKKKMVVQDRIHQEQLQTSRILEGKRNAYFDSIAAHIQANWSLLKNQMEDVGFLTTDLGLQIRRDGTISKIVIEKPSGNTLFDEFAVRAVKRSTPLPPFPDELKESKLEVTIGLSS
jgi:TonB family protein